MPIVSGKGIVIADAIQASLFYIYEFEKARFNCFYVTCPSRCHSGRIQRIWACEFFDRMESGGFFS